jgi:hypothetical protein
MSLMSKAPKIVPQTATDSMPMRMNAARKAEAKQKSVFLDICESN